MWYYSDFHDILKLQDDDLFYEQLNVTLLQPAGLISVAPCRLKEHEGSIPREESNVACRTT